MLLPPILFAAMLALAWPTITVRVTSTTQIPPEQLDAARRTFERAMVQAGVLSVWRYCGPLLSTGHERSRSCDTLLGPDEVVVRIVREPQANGVTRVPLGFSYIDRQTRSGVLATVFLDRLEQQSRRSRRDAGELLGHAIAHEVGHLLLGSTTHSPVGLMRPEWTDHEIRANLPQDWAFSPEDASRLQQRNRGARIRSSAP